MDKINVRMWGFDPRFGLFLKRVDDPDVHVDLYGKDGAESVAAMTNGNLEHAAINAFEGL